MSSEFIKHGVHLQLESWILLLPLKLESRESISLNFLKSTGLFPQASNVATETSPLLPDDTSLYLKLEWNLNNKRLVSYLLNEIGHKMIALEIFQVRGPHERAIFFSHFEYQNFLLWIDAIGDP